MNDGNIFSINSLVEVREYKLPSTDDEDDWIVECRMFWSAEECLFYPRIYRRIQMKMQPSDDKYTGKYFDEVTLTEESFLWDAGEKISAPDINQAFEVISSKFMYRLGYRSEMIDRALKNIVEV